MIDFKIFSGKEFPEFVFSEKVQTVFLSGDLSWFQSIDVFEEFLVPVCNVCGVCRLGVKFIYDDSSPPQYFEFDPFTEQNKYNEWINEDVRWTNGNIIIASDNQKLGVYYSDARMTTAFGAKARFTKEQLPWYPDQYATPEELIDVWRNLYWKATDKTFKQEFLNIFEQNYLLRLRDFGID